MLGMWNPAKYGFFLSVKSTFSFTLVISYGPTPGGGSRVSGFMAGAAAGNDSTFSKAPYGAVRWMTILPALSLVTIPLIDLALPPWKAAAPAMLPVKKESPPQLSLMARSMP